MENEILEYWFEGIDDGTLIDKNDRPFNKWFVQSDVTDKEIKSLFQSVYQRVRAGQYESWDQTPRGQLSLIILCDQFSRNMFRHQVEMFETDTLAVEVAQQLIDSQDDQVLQMIERIFIYMPLMHSEDLVVQTQSLQCFESLYNESKLKNSCNAHYYEYNLNYARKYYKLIKEVGRFPHRDKLLNRKFV